MGVGSAGVVKAGDEGNQALVKLRNSQVGTPVQFFLLQMLEKALHDRIVVGMALCGKGLDHPQLIDHLAEVLSGELASPICVEHDALGNAL